MGHVLPAPHVAVRPPTLPASPEPSRLTLCSSAPVRSIDPARGEGRLDLPGAGEAQLRRSGGPAYSASHAQSRVGAGPSCRHNKQVDIALDGRIDSVKNGRIRNTFEAVPDAPVTKFTLEMKGGKKGLLVNSTNLCARKNRAISEFTGQNGKIYDTNPVLKSSCGKHGKKAKGGKKH